MHFACGHSGPGQVLFASIPVSLLPPAPPRNGQRASCPRSQASLSDTGPAHRLTNRRSTNMCDHCWLLESKGKSRSHDHTDDKQAEGRLAYLNAEPWRSRVDSGAASCVGRLSGVRCCDPRTPAAGLCVLCRHLAVTTLCCPSLSKRDPTKDARLGFLTRGRAIDTRNALGVWRGGRKEGGRE